MLAVKEEIGKLDRRILIEQPVFDTDEDSNQRKITGWIDVDENPEPYAKVVEKTGTEVLQTDQIAGIMFAEFIIRYRTDLSLKYRIVYNNWTYNIQSILEIGRKRFLKIACEGGGQWKETDT